MVKFSILVIIFLFCFTSAKHLPSYLENFGKCHRNSTQFDPCVLETLQLALPFILKGDPKYNIPNMLPLEIPEIIISGGKNLVLKLVNISIIGLDDMKLAHVDVDSTNMKVKIKGEASKVMIIGNYDVKGQILVLPIIGKGTANFTFDDVTFIYSYSYGNIVRHNDQYFTIIGNHFTFDSQKAYLHLDRIFQDDERLNKETNLVINENWREIIDDMRPDIGETIGSIVTAIISGYYAHIPASELIGIF
ncbi:protein takeout-like [Chrysoperla carnea]|uniref:protein takeout-like n=1 Tax=Chrysoperla carnea TaxID=189513 RepID=UPI001D06FDF9|nr:protein takeout-like [Chrysoperla carnea]